MRAAECIPLADCRAPDREPVAHTVPPGQVSYRHHRLQGVRGSAADYALLSPVCPVPAICTSGRRSSDQARLTGGLPYGEPFESPTFLGSVEVNAGEADSLGAARMTEAVYRFNDQARGEVRRPVTVVPRIDVKIEPAVELWSTNSATPAPVHRHADPWRPGYDLRAPCSLRLPEGWPAVAPQTFPVRPGGRTRARLYFLVKAPLQAWSSTRERSGRWRAMPRVRRTASASFTVDYPHIRPRVIREARRGDAPDSSAGVAALGQVGYVRGAADQVPEALASVGVPVVLLSPGSAGAGKPLPV